MYVIAGAFFAAGFADFSLIAFHLQKAAVIQRDIIPVFYSLAMATAAIASLIFGKLLDKLGFSVLIIAFLIATFSAPFAFSHTLVLALIGAVLWGIGLGTQDSLLKAQLTNIVLPEQRSTAYGIFDSCFGIAWFLGSAAMGLLYEKSIFALVVFSVITQLLAIALLLQTSKNNSPSSY